jgi:predicted acylesterase/phospholipase RssA
VSTGVAIRNAIRLRPPPAAPRPVSACFGGGGFFAIAFNMGVADGLQDAGIPVCAGPMLGTSGGAWAAGALALSIGLDEVVDLTCSAKAGGLSQRESTRRVFNDSKDGRVRTTAVDVRTGQRCILRGDELGVADVVGASSSAPGLFPPYVIGSRRYIDGGMYSPTAANCSATSRLLVVVAPLAGPMVRPMGMMCTHLAKNEMRLWRVRTGGRVLFIRPSGSLAALAGRGFSVLLDPACTRTVYRHARDLALVRLERFAKRHPELMDAIAGPRSDGVVSFPARTFVASAIPTPA